MPKKHPNTTRWGGPGASHEDRTKPMPEEKDPRPDGGSTSAPVARVSGGGGERDEKHSHRDDMRSSKSHTTGTPSPTYGEDWKENRPRDEK